jgi:hypothetical protein
MTNPRHDLLAAFANWEAAFLDGNERRMTEALVRQLRLPRDLYLEAANAEEDEEQRAEFRRHHLILAHLVEQGETFLAEGDDTEDDDAG